MSEWKMKGGRRSSDDGSLEQTGSVMGEPAVAGRCWRWLQRADKRWDG